MKASFFKLYVTSRWRQHWAFGLTPPIFVTVINQEWLEGIVITFGLIKASKAPFCCHLASASQGLSDSMNW